jgi:hypothetical protein
MKRWTLPAATALAVCCGISVPWAAAAAGARDVPAAASAKAAAEPAIGVDLYAVNNYTAAQTQAYGHQMLSYIKDTLKANAVGIVWKLDAPSSTSDTVRATSQTLTAANVKILTMIARQDGLKVYYRPLIFISGTSRNWEGNIDPARPARWFRSYYRAELPYLRAAQQFHITEFVAETEMHDLNANPGWAAFFKKVAAVYRGTVSYASWAADYFPPDSHLQHLAALGMDFYEAMPRLPASASEGRVFAGWESFFRTVPASVLKRTTIDEVGIEARAGAYADPSNLETTGRLDQKVQANWFTAACRSVRRYDLRGVFFFKVDLADNPYHPTRALSVFEGRQGARAIAACAAEADARKP